MSKYLIIIIIVLLAVIGAGWKQLSHISSKYEVAEANVKAYSNQLGKEGEKNTALRT